MSNIWNKTAVLGGDGRQLSAARRLAIGGHEVAVWGLAGPPEAFGSAVRVRDWRDAIRGAQVILLPLPVTGDGVRVNVTTVGPGADGVELRLTHLLEALEPGQRIFGGRIPPNFRASAEDKGIRVEDYSANELFQIRNAVPTAEGAVEIAMRELPVTLAGIEAAVIGYGRIGRVLARLLSSLGARVTVAARKGSDLAWAELTGYLPHRIATDEGGSTLTALTTSRVIFNTVPHWLFTRDVMECLRQDVLLIDLASAPGGIDPQAAEEIGMRVIRAPGLPGKCAPETAGEITADTVIDIVAREGVVRT